MPVWGLSIDLDLEFWVRIDCFNNPDNFDRLQAYFNVIRYNIERGNNFFYFSKLGEPNSELEKKLERFERYIDIIDLFASMDNKIGIGSRFRPGEISEECNANVRLKQKLQKIRTKFEHNETS